MDIFQHTLETDFQRNPETENTNFGPWVGPSERNIVSYTSNLPRKQKNEVKFLTTMRPNKSKNDSHKIKFQKPQTSQSKQQIKDLFHRKKPVNFFGQTGKLKDNHYEGNYPNNRENHQTTLWEPLAATIYLYEKHQNHQKNRNSNRRSLESVNAITTTNGTRNLQRMLKIRQKIRIKNSSYVKKIKQQTINSESSNHHKQFQKPSQLKDRKWKSTTLVGPNNEEPQNYTKPSQRLRLLVSKKTLQA